MTWKTPHPHPPGRTTKAGDAGTGVDARTSQEEPGACYATITASPESITGASLSTWQSAASSVNSVTVFTLKQFSVLGTEAKPLW